MKKIRTVLVILLFIVLVLINATVMGKSLNSNSVSDSAKGFQKRFLTENKAEIVSEIKQIASKITALEKSAGVTGPEGFKIYSPEESKEFVRLYQSLQLRLHYLKFGNVRVDLNQWAGYSLSSDKSEPYDRMQVMKAMEELENNGLPRSFVTDFKIYLLPYLIPEVSGLGGAGYTMLSAQSGDGGLIDNQLEVTLYHEIGHHVHFSFMPKETSAGDELWAKFHQIRGGVWHGAGAVNTKAWEESSEETFAEDFRMLFGSEQPFFGDISLGDPRVSPEKAEKEKSFMVELAKNKTKVKYESPWTPKEELAFWQSQGKIISGLWVLLGAGLLHALYSGRIHYYQPIFKNYF